MRSTLMLCCFLAAGAPSAPGADDFLDRLDTTLSWTAAHDQIRGRVSGLLDLEAYSFDRPAPGFIRTDGETLLNPRLTLFLDAQLGPRVYFFAQSRVDRGFDPGQRALEWRLDEYALRFTPRTDGLINFQIGKFATVVGNWAARHNSWANPFITAPLAYEHQTGIHYSNAPSSGAQLQQWSAVAARKPAGYEGAPILWGPSYASGVAVSGTLGRMDYALELKNAALSSRPAEWDAARIQWQHPTFSGRLGYRPNASWYLGFSGSRGPYLSSAVIPLLPPEYTLGDYREVVWGQDLAYAWHHLQFWAEVYEASFAIPDIGPARTVSYYLEAKYKFTPQLAGAVRWNQQLYGDIPDGAGGSVKWGSAVWRVDLAPSYRFSPHTELKLQFSLQHGGSGPRRTSRLLALQYILRL